RGRDRRWRRRRRFVCNQKLRREKMVRIQRKRSGRNPQYSASHPGDLHFTERKRLSRESAFRRTMKEGLTC
ncbi:hypothetical protein Dimus_029235, partial [Dionaea muscipula]